MKKPKLFISFIICIIIFLSIIQVIVSNSLSTTGILMSRIENEIKLKKAENAVLREKVLTASSLTNVASQAGGFGFVEEKTTVFLTSPLPLAIKP